MPCPDMLEVPAATIASTPAQTICRNLSFRQNISVVNWLKLLIFSKATHNPWLCVCVCARTCFKPCVNCKLLTRGDFSGALGECPRLLPHLYFCLPLSLPPSPPTLTFESNPVHTSICIVFLLLRQFLMCIVVGELRAQPASFHFTD